MILYFAARFSRLPELIEYKHEIEALAPALEAEVTVNSRWLLGGHEWVGTPDEEIPVEHNAGFAQDDIDDLMAADLIVCFTESPRSGPARGGRHVEMGYALAKGKPILTVGHRENVFYCLPDVAFVPTWGQAQLWILSMATRAPHLEDRDWVEPDLNAPILVRNKAGKLRELKVLR
jgi:hypothetical protein